MLLHKTSTTKTVLAGSTQGSEFFIANDPTVHRQIGTLLRNMYSDLPWALIREYCANGIDANRMGDNADLPIDVTLPTERNSQLVIQDYGPGLDFTALKFMLTGYGNTDKRGRRSQIGGFGIGAKCGLGYTDTMVFESVYIVNGKRWRVTMLCFLDDELQAKSKFTSHKLVGNDVPTGITVKIPVPKSDTPSFSSALLNFQSSPELASKIRCMNARGNCISDAGILTPYKFGASTTVKVGNFDVKAYAAPYDSENVDRTREIIVLISGIPYKADLHQLCETAHRRAWGYVCGWPIPHPSIVLGFPPEAGIVPTPSREAITVTPKSAALILNTLDTLARDTSATALWRSFMLNKGSNATALIWFIAGFRMSPISVSNGYIDWFEQNELDNVREIMGKKRWVLHVDGRIKFLPPKGWLFVKRTGNSGRTLRVVDTNPRYSLSSDIMYDPGTMFYPSRIKDMPERVKKSIKANISAGHNIGIGTLLPPKLREFFATLPYSRYGSGKNTHVMLAEDPTESVHEPLDDMLLADPAAPYFSWKSEPRIRTPRLSSSSGTSGFTHTTIKDTVDYYVVSCRGNVEIPSLHVNNKNYATPNSGVGWTWSECNAEVRFDEKMAARLIGVPPKVKSYGYNIKREIPSNLTDGNKDKMLWPIFVKAAKEYVNKRPVLVRNWIRSQLQVSTLDRVFPSGLIKAISDPAAEYGVFAKGGKSGSSALNELAWLIARPDVAINRNGVNEMDAWLGSKLRGSGTSGIWPTSIFSNGDPTPYKITEDKGSCSRLGLLFALLIKANHPFIEVCGILGQSSYNEDTIDSKIAGVWSKYYNPAEYPKLWEFIKKYK